MPSPTKYHFSTKTNKIVVCTATKKACQYGTHYNTPEEAANNIASNTLNTANLIEGITKPPVILTPMKPPGNMTPEEEEWYRSQANATDKHGVLEYVRSKGTHTNGLKPLEALQKQLTEENAVILATARFRSIPWANTTKVERKRIPLKEIIVPGSSRLKQVQAKAPESFDKTPGIAGIVLKTENGYKLIDGFHRMKYLQSNNIPEGDYFVLS